METKSELSILCKRYIESVLKNRSGDDSIFFDYRGIIFPRSFLSFIDFFHTVFLPANFCDVFKHREIYQKIISLQSTFCTLLENVGCIRPVFFPDRESMTTISELSEGMKPDGEKMRRLKKLIDETTSLIQLQKHALFFKIHHCASVLFQEVSKYMYDNYIMISISKEAQLYEVLLDLVTNKKYFTEQEKLWKKYKELTEILIEISELLSPSPK